MFKKAILMGIEREEVVIVNNFMFRTAKKELFKTTTMIYTLNS